MATILFLHGLGGVPSSRTSRIIQEHFPNDFVFAPEVLFDPNEEAKLLWDLYMTYKPIIVIGVSLGAFYAMKLGGCHKILINPAMFPDEDIRDHIGVGTKVPVRNTHMTIDEAFLDKLKKQKEFFYEYCLDSEFKLETCAIFGKNDKVFSHIDDYKKLYGKKYIIVEDGHHLSDDTINNILIPLIQKYKDEEKNNE